MIKELVIVGLVAAFPFAAMAEAPNPYTTKSQAQPQSVPSDLDIEKQRAIASEEQVRLLMLIVQRQNAERQATAEYWAEIWKALPTKN